MKCNNYKSFFVIEHVTKVSAFTSIEKNEDEKKVKKSYIRKRKLLTFGFILNFSLDSIEIDPIITILNV